MASSPRDANVSQLRDAIDTGKTGDKVAAADPAAAPLGADAEAGGNPPRPAEIDRSLRQETRRHPAPGKPGWVVPGLVIAAVLLVSILVLVLL